MDKAYKEVAPVSEEERAAITRKTAYSLPDEPSARGMTPDQIRKRFWEAMVGDRHSLLAEINRVAKETNAALGSIAGSTGGMSGVLVTPQMYGAMGDGVTDDTAAIQAALDASSYVYIPDGVYLVNGTHDGWGHSDEGGIKPKSNQVIELSNNAVLKAKENKNGFYNIVNIVGVENVHIIGGKVQGIKTTPTSSDYGSEFGHGVHILASKNITIEHMEIFDCWGDSVGVGHFGGVNCSDVQIFNCALHDSRRQGISVTGALGVVIRDCEIYNIRGTAPQFGIDIEPDDAYGKAENIFIDGCYLHDNGIGDIVLADIPDPVKNPVKNIRISNSRTTGTVVCYSKDANVILEANAIYQLYLETDNVIVSNCDIEAVVPVGGSGIFTNCRFKSETSSGLIVGDASTDKIADHLIFNSCDFKIVKNGQYLFNGKKAPEDDVFPQNLIKFADCQIEAVVTVNTLIHNYPRKLVFDGCGIKFNSKPHAAFSSTTGDVGMNVSIRDTEVISDSGVGYVFEINQASDHNIEIFSSKFCNFTYFVGASSAGTSGGTIRLLNNIMSNTTVRNTNTFVVTDANNIPTKVSELENDKNYLTSFTESDPTVPAWAKESSKPKYTADEVGADKSGTASAAVSGHNTNTAAHNDIRLLINELAARLNAFANSTDEDLDQAQEFMLYIKANRDLISQITTSKVSVSDIINNLATNVSNKPLSAAQGVALKALIDAITVPTKVSELSNDKNYLTLADLPRYTGGVS